MKTEKMNDYMEGKLHYCVELKGRLVHPAEIEGWSPSKTGKWCRMNSEDRDKEIVCESEKCSGGRMRGKDKLVSKNISPANELFFLSLA